MKLLEVVAVFLIVFAGYFTTNGIKLDVQLANNIMRDNANDICATLTTSSGMACSDCYNVVYCSKESDKWVVEPIGQCPAGKICKEGSCVIGTQCPLPNLKFQCLSKGSFPDPADCKKYHVCVADATNTLVHYESTCENSNLYGYNPLTTVCSDKLINEECKTFYVPTCSINFYVGVVTINPSLYYQCKNYTDASGKISRYLYPYQQLCPNGKKFDLKTEKCL